LGAELQDLDAASIKALGLDQAHGVLIILPVPDGPADKAGLKTADVAVALNGRPVPSVGEFIQQIGQAGNGAALTLEIWRRSERVTLPVVLGNAKNAPEAGDSGQLIAAYDTLTTAFPKATFPFLWAGIQNNLGLAYGNRIQGNRAENLEAAIRAFE